LWTGEERREEGGSAVPAPLL